MISTRCFFSSFKFVLLLCLFGFVSRQPFALELRPQQGRRGAPPAPEAAPEAKPAAGAEAKPAACGGEGGCLTPGMAMAEPPLPPGCACGAEHPDGGGRRLHYNRKPVGTLAVRDSKGRVERRGGFIIPRTSLMEKKRGRKRQAGDVCVQRRAGCGVGVSEPGRDRAEEGCVWRGGAESLGSGDADRQPGDVAGLYTDLVFIDPIGDGLFRGRWVSLDEAKKQFLRAGSGY